MRLSAMEESCRKEFAAAVPLACLGDPRGIAEAIVFLSSDASSYIKGATLDVNGGRFMMSSIKETSSGTVVFSRQKSSQVRLRP